MIKQEIKIRDEYKDDVYGFCYLFDINIRNYNHEMVMIDSESNKIVKLLDYINKLEHERLVQRKNKSFWWRLWN